jgi:hypothetical protein
LFAVEIKRILSAKIGIMEKVDMLMIACAMQVMRTLATQSYRHSQVPCNEKDGFDYRILLCDSVSRKRKIKKFSTESLSEVVRVIQQAIRTDETKARVQEIAEKDPLPEKKYASIYKDADSYGFKLYRKIGKSIGLIVPETGRWMRYTLNEKILRYLVISLIPGQRMTLETFKRQMEAHHGIVFDLDRLKVSRNWSARTEELKGSDSSNEFLERMPRSVLQSNWYYGKEFDLSKLREKVRPEVETYAALEKRRFDQMPCGSTYSCRENFGKTVEHCRNLIADDRLKGFFMAPWYYRTQEDNRAKIMESLDVMGEAIAKWGRG